MSQRLFSIAFTVGLTVLLGCSSQAIANPMDLNQPEHALTAFRKIACSLEDGKTVYLVWQGEIYSRVPGEPDRHLFNLQGVSTRACVSLAPDTGSADFRQVTREVMLYLDPNTNAQLERWENPWTGAMNTVVSVANDPVNASLRVETTGQRLQFQTFGEIDLAFLQIIIPLFYPNPLGDDYQNYIGGHYHAIEMFNFAVSRSALLNSDRQDVEQVAISWSRISPWLPWMEMGSRPGELVFQAVGTRLSDWQQLPEPLRSQIATDFALYQTPPPLDDSRPSETTWTNFRDYLESQPQE